MIYGAFKTLVVTNLYFISNTINNGAKEKQQTTTKKLKSGGKIRMLCRGIFIYIFFHFC